MCECSVFPVIDLPGTGRNIQRLRQKAGVTVRELQAYFGFEYPQAIYKWQHGECLPSVDNLLALARVLRVPMEDLLVYEDREVSYFWVARSVFDIFNDRFGACCHGIFRIVPKLTHINNNCVFLLTASDRRCYTFIIYNRWKSCPWCNCALK